MPAPEKLDERKLIAHIRTTIPDFHIARAASLQALKLRTLVQSKNPYLFRAKNILVAGELVERFMAAHLSSQEESIFGGFLERLAVYVGQSAWHGRKSAAEGIDLEFEKDGMIHIVAIKSGPSWGNSSQIARMRDNFAKAARILRTNAPSRAVIAVNGCCYGRTAREDRGTYLKICGQSFWEFISGDPELYRQIIDPLGDQARKRNEEFQEEYAKVVNHFTQQFIRDFCHADGSIDWDKLLVFNSARLRPKMPRLPRAGPG